jgi:hypothetical protein
VPINLALPLNAINRSIDGTYHHVSREHLRPYLAEFGFRYSTRKMSDTDPHGSNG